MKALQDRTLLVAERVADHSTWNGWSQLVTNSISLTSLTTRGNRDKYKYVWSVTTMPAFTVDFLSVYLDTWNKVFNADWKSTPVKALEIGTYEGRSACWLLDNVLLHQDSHLVCIDNFVGIGEHNPNNPLGLSVKDRCLQNLSEYSSKVELIQGDSKLVMKQMDPSQLFDLIYIDGDHTAQGVLTDAVLAFSHLKLGGLMIFDDYLWLNSEKRRWFGPKEGIDAFLNCFRCHLQIISANGQLMVSKVPDDS